MRALVLMLILMVPLVAHAEESKRAQLGEYTSAASKAATAGDCATVRELAATVSVLDENYYVTVFASDEAIIACVPALSRQAAAVLARVSAPLPRETTRPGPPVEGGRIVAQLMLGGIGQLVGGSVGLFLGVSTGSLEGMVLFSAVGSTVGLSGGVYVASRYGGRSGSFGWTYFGAMTGLVVTGLPALTFAKYQPGAALGTVLAGSMIGALVANTATRHWRENASAGGVGSLIQLDRGKASLGVPLVTHSERRGVATTHVPLLGGSF